MTKLIGLSGKSGSGKDHIAQHILRPLGYHQFSLSWHFKVETVGLQHGTRQEVFHTKPNHIRQRLQLRGTEEGRMVYGDDVWCRHALEWMYIFEMHWGIDRFVLADIRYPNEVKFVQSNGGLVFRVEAPNRVAQNKLSPEQRQHDSEIALDGYSQFDGTIYNDEGDDAAAQLLPLLHV
jgi:hypothetical protein